jgi:Tol biopolymer transport system component
VSALVVSATALVVLAAVGLGRNGRFSRIEDPAEDTSRRPSPYLLAEHAGFNGFPAFAPDGRQVAFASDRSGVLEIYLQTLTPASAPVRLSAAGGQNIEPAWSPDGRFIAHQNLAAGGIWISPVGGGGPRRIAIAGARPAWSPDGRRIAFHSPAAPNLGALGRPTEPSTVWMVDADGDDAPIALTEAGKPEGPHLVPVWLPGSTRILFVVPDAPTSSRAAGAALWRVDIRTRALQRIITHEQLTPEYALAPEGRGIYFRSSENTIWFLPLDEHANTPGEPQITDIPAIGSVVAHPSMSADGRRIAWTAVESGRQIWASYLRGDVITAPIGDGPTERSSENELTADDGRNLVTTHRDGVWNIAAVSKSTSEVRPLTRVTTPRIVLRDPRWDLRNDRVLFERTETTGRIWTADLPQR